MLFKRRFSPRYLIGLIEQLPDDGALAASLQGGPEFRGWGRDRHMAADRWEMHLAELSDPKKGKPPSYPRPSKKQGGQGRSLRSMFPGGR